MIRKLIRSTRHSIRRKKEAYFPDSTTLRYRSWIQERSARRAAEYSVPLQPGLLSVLTAIWDGSPVSYLKQLANSLVEQNRDGACQWVLLDNGCRRRELLQYLEALKRYAWIQVHRSEQNLGILSGLRHCLERASGRYVLPVDGDDLLNPDALKIVTAYLEKNAYPPILYTDEDKVASTGVSQPYFKPDWDPVLLANSAYIAHLGVINREEALRLGAYSDQSTEGSPDWDLFLRFAAAGHSAVHIPEISYSWRMHPSSTADTPAIKSYISSSQQAVLSNYLERRGLAERFSVEKSRFFPGDSHWHFRRQSSDQKPISCFLFGGDVDHAPGSYNFVSVIPLGGKTDPRHLSEVTRTLAEHDEFVGFLDANLRIDNEDWIGEALGLFELFPDTVMVGGRILDANGAIVDAGQQLGFGGVCGSPDRGRSVNDPGYFGQVWKQRSVGAVSIQCAVIRASFLADVCENLPQGASLAFLGPWLGARARQTSKRVIYTPFLGGVAHRSLETLVSNEERRLFLKDCRDILPDRRYYPKAFSLVKGYALTSEDEAAQNFETSQSPNTISPHPKTRGHDAG